MNEPRKIEKHLGLLAKCFFLLVGAGRFELPTPTTPLWCATKLRYAPKERCILGMRRFFVNETSRSGLEYSEEFLEFAAQLADQLGT